MRAPAVKSRNRSSSLLKRSSGENARIRGRGELDRERKAIEALTECADRRARRSRRFERRRDRACALHEQRDGIVELERRERPEHLAGDHQRLAARRQDAQLAAAADEILDHLRGLGDDVLTVVEDQQHVAPEEELA